MARRNIYALKLGLDGGVSPRHHHDLQRHFDSQHAAIEVFNRADAETAGELQENGAIALQSL